MPDTLDKYSVRRILTGDVDNHDPYLFSQLYSYSVLEKLLDRLKEMYRLEGKFEWYKFKEAIKEYRNKLAEETNYEIIVYNYSLTIHS